MVSEESGSVAVLAEKPSVARDIARVLGANTKGNGYLHGNGYVVTWAIGHLAAMAPVAPAPAPHAAGAMAPGDLREDQGPVRNRSTDPEFAEGLPLGVRHG